MDFSGMTLTQIKRQEMDSQVGTPFLRLARLYCIWCQPQIFPWCEASERETWEEMNSDVSFSPRINVSDAERNSGGLQHLQPGLGYMMGAKQISLEVINKITKINET